MGGDQDVQVGPGGTSRYLGSWRQDRMTGQAMLQRQIQRHIQILTQGHTQRQTQRHIKRQRRYLGS